MQETSLAGLSPPADAPRSSPQDLLWRCFGAFSRLSHGTWAEALPVITVISRGKARRCPLQRRVAD
eukprot:scaffold145507_cov21-Tisochrysis_lutea.AAC.1